MTTLPPRLVHDDEGLNTGAWPVPNLTLVTPVESFFTRSHAAVPHIDAASWSLEVSGMVERPRRFSLAELLALFPTREVVATLVCAGMRRAEFLTMGPLPGELPWGPEPASTGVWSGIALRDVLESAGVLSGAGHVELVGLDQVTRNDQQFGFGGSVDLAKAMSEEVLLATSLNGEPLTPDHGFPMRALVPGWIGARSIKWLGHVKVTSEPSFNYFQRLAYRVQRTADPENPRDVSMGEALGEVPVNSVIVEPGESDSIPAGKVRVRGWAIGSGCSPLRRVEVSADDGEWIQASIAPDRGDWTWALWEATVELAPGSHTFAVRAVDMTGSSQPATLESTWNVKGYVNNVWHRVSVKAV